MQNVSFWCRISSKLPKQSYKIYINLWKDPNHTLEQIHQQANLVGKINIDPLDRLC